VCACSRGRLECVSVQFLQTAFDPQARGVGVAQLYHHHSSPSWKSRGRLMAASLFSPDAQAWLSSKIRLISAKTDVRIAVVASSIAYASTHSCFARFPTRAFSRASAPLYPFTNKRAATGYTLNTQKSNEATVWSIETLKS